MKKKDYQQKFAEECVILAMETEREKLKRANSAEEEETYCKNLKILAEAFAAVNGW